MPTTIHGHEAVAGYRAIFDRLAAGRRREPAWLRVAREQAMTAFEERGLPTTRDEEWRFTSVAPLASRAFPLATGGDAAAGSALAQSALVQGLAGPVLVFVDGRFVPALSRRLDVRGVQVGSLASLLLRPPDWLEGALARDPALADHPFAALNTALFDDGPFLYVEPGVVLEEAVQFVFVSSGAEPSPSIQARALVYAAANSQARLVESYVAPEGAHSFTNAVTEIVAGEGAVIEHCRIQREAQGTFHIGQTRVEIGRSASVASHAVSMGARLARHDARARLAGRGADCTLNGFYLAEGDQLIDNHTEIDHATPDGTSHEVYKGILGGRARGVFNGRIKVRPDAQKTDAKQTNKTLLLSDEAQINTKPQLEILANDVKCTHGATVGQLNPEALFYLRTRGIGAEDAKSLLIRAFAMDVISKIRLEPVAAALDRLVASRLPGSLAEKAFA